MKGANYFLAVVLLFSASVKEGNASTELPPVVVTGSRIAVQGIDKQSSVVVIDRNAIERQNPGSLAQLLHGIPGIYVENAGAGGNISAVYLRGAEPNYTLVLIDGVAVNDPSNTRGGVFDFSLLNINSVDRVEIVKGPASYVYGSAAMAGVINIITRKIKKSKSVSVDVETDSNGKKDASVLAGFIKDRGEVSLQASYKNADNQDNENNYESKAFVINGAMDVSDKTEILLTGRINDSEANAFPDASGGKEFAIIRDVDRRETNSQQTDLRINYNQSNRQQLITSLSVFTTNEDLWSPGIDASIPVNESESSYERKNLLVFYQARPNQNIFTSFGLELIREKGNSQGILDYGGFTIPTEFDLTRNSNAFFIEGKYHVNKSIVWSAGIREDQTERFKSNASPHFSFQYNDGKGQYLFSWGRGFKLPSFFALGHPLVGNPDFRPETSESFDVSVKYQTSPAVSYNAALFYNTYFNLIDFGDSGVLVSWDEVTIKGIELGIDRYISENLLLKGFYTVLGMNIKDSSEVLHKRPERNAGVQINWKMTSRLNSSVKANYIGNVRDFSYPTGDKTLESYVKTDVTVNWKFSSEYQGSVAIDNVFNEKYYESIGNEATGALLRIALSGSFL